MKAARGKLEALAAVVVRTVVVDAGRGGHRHTSELERWDQRFAEPRAGGIEELVVAGVRSAVVAAQREVGRWFSWPADVAALIAAGRLAGVDGSAAIPASGS